jgi:glycosyltransferase involved in cell wall biosynthesis
MGELLAGRSVALVHEWFSALGGSENVFLDIAEILPHAQRFVLWKEDEVGDEHDLRESWLARTPMRKSKSLALPLMPTAWRTLSNESFDVVLSSSHAFAHTVKLGSSEDTRYLSYVHSPARYVWSPELDMRGANPLLSLPRKALQKVDTRLSRHVHSYAANSREVRKRIQQYWHRDAVVINPPVDVDYFRAAPLEQTFQPRDYLLAAGRWVSYKNFDLAITIAAAAGVPIVVAGSGPEEQNLRRTAETSGARVIFEERPSRERLRELYWGALALVFPAHEDFGIMPVEAQACGTPVLGLRRGGLLETVEPEVTGFLVDSLEPRDYAPFVRRLAHLDRSVISKHAGTFSRQAFQTAIAAWVTSET